jgi:hypothetical protein
MTSAYEEERKKNIDRNNKLLERLGLRNIVPKKHVFKKVQAKPHPAPYPVELRRSLRASGNRDYAELSDAFCLAEERALQRPKREMKAPKSVPYHEQQALDQEMRQAKILKRKSIQAAQPAAVTTHAPTQMVNSAICKFDIGSWEEQLFMHNSTPYQVIDQEGPYPTQGKRGMCPICHNHFVLKRDGTMRKHDCIPS